MTETTVLSPVNSVRAAMAIRDLRTLLLTQIVLRLARYGLSQTKLARLIGVSRPRLNRLLNKDADGFTLDSLAGIAVKAGLTVRMDVARPYRR